MSSTDSAREQGTCDVTELIGLLTEQHDLYGRLARLAEHQRSLIVGEETERLLVVLGQRQKIIDRLEALADQLRPYQRHWREIRSRMAECDGKEADRLVGEMNTLLSTILEKDRADVQELAARKGSVVTEMAGLKMSREAGAAYAAAGTAGQSRVDWTDE